MQHWRRVLIATVGGLLAVLWSGTVRAEKVTICFATGQNVCGSNNHGGDKFVSVAQLDVLGHISDSRALEAAKRFCNSGKPIRQISNKNFSGIYQVAEFDCDKK